MSRNWTTLLCACLFVTTGSCTKLFSAQSKNSISGTVLRKAPESTPICQQVGTSNEGWYINGKNIKTSPCEGRVTDCVKQNSQEGWFSFVKKDMRLVRYDSCAGKNIPACVNVGTKSEGWQGEDWFQWDSCAGLAIMCDAVGTRSEGWHSFEQKQIEFLAQARCEDI
jgi:hypothetical protein